MKSNTTATTRDLYAEVTENILAALRRGVVPWRRDWSATADTPRSWDGRLYRGANWLLLGCLPYERPVFLTFKKALDLGGSVRKGERGHLVVFWKFFKTDKTDASTGKAKCVPMLRHYHVFNVAQCDGLPELKTAEERPFDPIPECERIVAEMPQRPALHHDGRGRCYYRPSSDSVHMTDRSAFQSEEGYYSTLFHELAHSTGHATRLDRPGVTGTANFGSDTYSREELVAEMTSAFISSHAGIAQPVIENQTAYLDGWLKVLQEDTKAIIWASGKAARAADFILGQSYEDQEAAAA